MVQILQIQNVFTCPPLLKARNLMPYSRVLYSANRNEIEEYKKCYNILNLSENSDQHAVRDAYLKLVKRYHPDSSSNQADANKFQEVERAFRILMDKHAKERWQVPEEESENDVPQHAIPQHRHYLGFEGIGYGTVFQREKQYSQGRAMQATQAVMNHRIQKEIAEDKSLVKKSHQRHNIKTKYGFDRLVEDLIQEAISKGQFDNLSGFGKPLSNVKKESPYVDFVTHKLNEILIENGFTPQWITLQKEIRDDLQLFRDLLNQQRIRFSRYPLDKEELLLWKNVMNQHKPMMDEINRKIKKFNLLVPILNRQIVCLDIEKEGNKVLLDGKSNQDIMEKEKITDTTKTPGFIYALLQTWFKI